MPDDLPMHRFTRRPLLGLCGMFLAGTLVGLRTVEFPWVALGAGLGLAAMGLFWRGAAAERVRGVALHAAMFLIAVCAACPVLRGITVVPPAGAENQGRSDIVGVVSGDPDRLPSANPKWATWRVPFRVERWREPDGTWVDVNLPVTIWWGVPTWAEVPRYGDRYLVHDARWPKARKHFRDPSLTLINRNAEWLSRGHGSALQAWCYTARARAAAHLVRGIEDFPEEAGIQQALMLGYRQRLSDRVSDLGAITGTLHIFAISGSHVVIVAGMVVFVLRALRVPRARWVLILGPLLVAYTLAVGAEASAVRACVMAIVCFMAPAVGRKADGATALACAAMLIVGWDPTQVLDVGFVLSFVVVAGLIGLYPLFLKLIPAWPVPDPLAVDTRTGASRLQRMGRTLADATGSLLALSVAAWLTSAPLTAYYFERFTPVTLLANLIVVPLAFLMVLSGCLSIVFGSAAGVLAEVFNHASFALIRAFVVLADWLARVPFANMTVPKPALGWMVLYYGLLVIGAAWWWARARPGKIEQAAIDIVS